jgi:hypothetical protein
MFPWSPEFRWDTGHVFFFGALYTVLTTIVVTIIASAFRARASFQAGHGQRAAWLADFGELPRSARACRHQLRGVAPERACGNAFDCRHCENHPALAERGHVDEPCDKTRERIFGFDMPLDRLYHRGHTWVRPEADGTATVGLDDLAKRLIGTTEEIVLPKAGTRLSLNAPMCRLRTHGSIARVLAPLDGTVVASLGTGTSFELRLRPERALDTRHLLSAAEVRPWMLREVDRLQTTLTATGTTPALADGFDLVPDVGGSMPRRRYSALLGDLLLEP